MVPSQRVSYSFQIETHAILLRRDDGLGGLMLRAGCWYAVVGSSCKTIGSGFLKDMIRTMIQTPFTSQTMSMNLLAIRDPMRDRSCGPCGVSSNWRQQRNDGRSLRLRRRRASRPCDCTCVSGESLAE